MTVLRALAVGIMTSTLACAITSCSDRPTLAGASTTETRQNATLRQQLEEMQGLAGAPEVPVIKLAPAPIAEELSITGELVPKNSVIVKPLMDGRITFLKPIKVGDMVKKGDLIAKIDDRDIEDDVKTQQQQIAIGTEKIRLDEQSLAQSNKDLEFDRQLVKEKFLNQHEFEKSEMSMKQAEITLRQSKLTLEQDQSKLSKALRLREKVPIAAPIGGMVVLASHLTSEEKTSTLLNEEILSLEGQLVGTATPIFGIVSDDGYLAQCQANGRDKAKIQEGQAAHVTVITYKPVTVNGKVNKISLLQDAKSHAYKVWMGLDETDKSFTSGLFVRANIQLARRTDALVVKKEYVKERNNRQFVQVVQGGAIKDRWVTTGLAQDDKIELESGVKAGEMIVASKEVFAAEQAVKPTEVKAEEAEGGADAVALKVTPEEGALPVVIKRHTTGEMTNFNQAVAFESNEASSATRATLHVSATGPLKLTELEFLMNKHMLAKPGKIMFEGKTQSAVIEIPAKQLQRGKNTVTVQLNGYHYVQSETSIDKLELWLEKP